MGADEMQRGQARMAADGNKRGGQGWLLTKCKEGRPRMGADEMQRRRPGMAATWIMKTNE